MGSGGAGERRPAEIWEGGGNKELRILWDTESRHFISSQA